MSAQARLHWRFKDAIGAAAAVAVALEGPGLQELRPSQPARVARCWIGFSSESCSGLAGQKSSELELTQKLENDPKC